MASEGNRLVNVEGSGGGGVSGRQRDAAGAARGSRRRRHLRRAAAVGGPIAAAVSLVAAGLASADVFNLNATDNATIQPGGARTGANGKNFLNLENDAQNANASYGVIDFGAIYIGNNLANSINGLTLSLYDAPSAFSSTGNVSVNFYLATNTTTSIQPGTTPLRYLSGTNNTPAPTPQGVGGTALGGLTLLGSGTYTKTAASGIGNQFNYTLTNVASLSAAIDNYILGQINNNGALRLVATISDGSRSPALAATYAGFGNNQTPTSPVQLSLDLNVTALPSNDSNLFVGTPGNTSTTIDLGRVIKGVTTAGVPVTIGNSGTSAAHVLFDTTQGATGALATNPVPGGGTASLTAALSSTKTNVAGGTDVSGTLGVINTSNTNAANLSVGLTAHVIENRQLQNDSIALSNHGAQYGNILVGTTYTNAVTVNTQNLSLHDANYVNTVSLPAFAGTNGVASFTNTTYQLIGTNTSGAVTFTNDESANFLLAAKAVKSGSVGVGTSGAFLRFNGTNGGVTGEGLAGETDAINLYAEWTAYAPASVTATASAPTLSGGLLRGNLVLANAGANDNGTNSLRLGATVTASSSTAQAGFSLGSLAGTAIPAPTGTAATSVSAPFTFDPTSKLNGAYTGTAALTLQNDDSTVAGGVQGLKANDLGVKLATLAATVSGNSGDGTANILKGGSYGGYYINRGSGSNTTVQFLGGTASANTNLGVNWSTSAAKRAAGDVAAVSGSGTDTVVVQFSYDPTKLPAGAGTASIAVGLFNGTRYVNAGGTAVSEVRGAFDNNFTVGHYGIDTTNHVVWAVVNAGGSFTPYSRVAGDTKFRGQVDSTDINQIVQHGHYNNGLASTWTDGDFTGDGLVTSTDINAIVQAGFYNTGPYDTTAIGAAKPAAAKTLTGGSVSPASTTVGVAGDGIPDYKYDPATGDVTFIRDGLDSSKIIQTLTLRSAGNKFITGVGYTSNNNSGVDVDQTDEQFVSRFSGIAKTTPFTFDLGNILPTNLTPDALKNDLSLFYDYQGDGATGDGIPVGLLGTVPEPATLSLLAIGSGALLTRRRRKTTR